MLSIEELRNLASLARIAMPDNELEELRSQLDEIIGFVGEVQKADTTSLKLRGASTSSVGEVALPELRNVFRDDGVPHETGKFTRDIVANFPDSKDGYLRVKKILEK
ncbi:MAG TPA: Asp-tRNA(Asn)/Glu-tRNA(Gln) amidotransferase subunit GatC [Candidatus Paceibacterota bacterium]